MFGPWGLDDFKDITKTYTIMEEVFRDAGLVFDKTHLDWGNNTLLYIANSYAQARKIVDAINALGERLAIDDKPVN